IGTTGRAWPGRLCSRASARRHWAIRYHTGPAHRRGKAMVKRYASLISLSLLAGPAHADLPLPVTSLSDAGLDQLRGGFVMNNLEISIGLEQVLAVNGQTLVVNRLTIRNLNDPMAADRLSTQLASIQGAWESGAGQLALDTAV